MNASGAEQRILIVRVGAMGDVLHGMPAVAALRAALPQVHIAWAVEPRWAPLLMTQSAHVWQASLPLVDALHLVEAKAWSKRPFSFATLQSINALRHALRAEQYDIAIDLQGTLRSAVIARFSGAPRIVGSDHPREWPARLMYSERVPLRAPHVVDQAAEMASAAAGSVLHPAPAPLPVDTAAEGWCDTLLRNAAGPSVLLAPTAGWGAKEWPEERYGELARGLHAHGYRVLVNASPRGPDPVADRVIAASGNTALRTPCTLPQLIELARRVSLVVAGDTGPLHLAAALGVPVVALFGPTDPKRNGPYETRATVLRHASSQTDHRRHAATEAGLRSITTEEVLEAALGQLRRHAHDDRRAY